MRHLMPFGKILCLTCIILYATCLGIGGLAAGQWGILAAALVILTAWLISRKWTSSWLPHSALVISIIAAIAGLFAGASPILMLLSATLALASWDEVLWEHALKDGASAETIALLDKKHNQSLALALVPGFLAAIAGRMIHLQIPFVGMAFLIILVLFCMDRALRALHA